MTVFSTKIFTGKTVVVTGSSSGIGREIALAFAVAGANVVIHGRSPSAGLTSVAEEIVALGVTAKTIHCDFSRDDFAAERFVDRAWQQFGAIDVWVNNAGGDVLTGELTDKSFDEKLEYLLRVDVRATLGLSRAVGAKMVEQKATEPSSIVNIGWDQAWIGMQGDSGDMFATTKGAIMSATKSLAHSFAPHVRVNCVAPGWIKTAWGESANEYWDQRACRQSLMNRWGQPADIAGVAVFLASPAAAFVSGQVINVNGGFNSYSETH